MANILHTHVNRKQAIIGWAIFVLIAAAVAYTIYTLPNVGHTIGIRIFYCQYMFLIVVGGVSLILAA